MEQVIIIAEAGVNHNGSIELAKKLIDAAHSCGVDYVKFQTFKADKIANRFAPQSEYQEKNLKSKCTQAEMLKKFELGFNDFSALYNYCKALGTKFLSTPFDIESIHFLSSLGMDYMKIPSGEITNLPFLRKIASIGIPVIISTGMCNLEEIEAAIAVMYNGGLTTDKITLLHCNTEYPTPMVDVNLRAMETLRSTFGTKIGYSDHTKGIEVPIAAVAMGASVIEKHFTIDNNLSGPDHIASLEPDGLKSMVDSIRNIEVAMGHPEKIVTASERKNIVVARKSIVASTDIKKGEILTEENLTVKRPGNGISPMLWDSIIGKRAIREFHEDELIEV